MISILKRLIIVTACGFGLAACADFPTMLAGGARGFCQSYPGDGPCTRPAPGHTDHAPPR